MEFLASSDSQDYGCPGLSITGSAIAVAEVAESRKISVERTNHNGLIVLIFVDRFSVSLI